MNRIIASLITGSLMLTQAAQGEDSVTTSAFGMDQARSCIAQGNELDEASKQLQSIEQHKNDLASKIHYLEGVVKERKTLIESLDKRNYQQNNQNYNELVEQYESLSQEHRDTISQYNQQHKRHLEQYNKINQLDQQFAQSCLKNINLTADIYRQACTGDDSRWCSAFSFN